MATKFLEFLRVKGACIVRLLCPDLAKSLVKSRCRLSWCVIWISIVAIVSMCPLMAQQPWKDYGSKKVSFSTTLEQNGTTAKVTITLTDTCRLAALHIKIGLPTWLRTAARLEFDQLTGPLTIEPSALVTLGYKVGDSTAAFFGTRPLLDLVVAQGNAVSFDVYNMPSGQTLEASDIVVQCEGIVIVDHVPLRLGVSDETNHWIILPNPQVQVAPTIINDDFWVGFTLAANEHDVTVFDSMGQKVWSGILTIGTQHKVECSAWTQGIYYVCIQGETPNMPAIKLVKY